MTLNSAAHIEMMDFFDRQYRHCRLDKEPKDMWPKRIIYQNGEINELFLAFRTGVAYGQAVERE